MLPLGCRVSSTHPTPDQDPKDLSPRVGTQAIGNRPHGGSFERGEPSFAYAMLSRGRRVMSRTVGLQAINGADPTGEMVHISKLSRISSTAFAALESVVWIGPAGGAPTRLNTINRTGAFPTSNVAGSKLKVQWIAPSSFRCVMSSPPPPSGSCGSSARQ